MYNHTITTMEFIKEVARHRLWESNYPDGKQADFSNTRIIYNTDDLRDDLRDRVTSIIGINFDNASFTGTNIRNLEFANCSMKGVDFTDATLDNCAFQKCNLSATSMTQGGFANATLHEVDFTNSELSNVKFTHAVLISCFANECDFTNAKLHHLELNNSTFFKSTFDNATLSFVTAGERCTFDSCSFHDSKFLSSSLCNVDFSKSTIEAGYMMKTNLNGSDMRDIEFKGVDILDSNFEQAKLSVSALPWLQRGMIHLEIRDKSRNIPYQLNKETGRIASEALIGAGESISLGEFRNRIKSGELVDTCFKKFFHKNKLPIQSKVYARFAIKNSLNEFHKSVQQMIKSNDMQK